MALRRVALATTALSIGALAAWFGGLGLGDIPEASGIRSMTVDAPFQAPEPTAEVEAAAVPVANAPASVEQLASRDALAVLLALVAIVGFGIGLETIRAESRGGRRRVS